MQGLTVLMAAAQGMLMRRVLLLRRCGFARAARRLYAQLALGLSVLTYASMLLQEALLWRAGLLTWTTGLPLHVCSAVGLLIPPMLLRGSRRLWHVTLYLGVPAGLLATVFPSVLPTPWMGLSRLSFHVLHGCVMLAPLLPLCMEERPSPAGAGTAGLFLLGLAAVAAGVNRLTGANYCFLNLPAAGTPLALLARGGLTAYRCGLAGICAAVLAAESAAVALMGKRH